MKTRIISLIVVILAIGATCTSCFTMAAIAASSANTSDISSDISKEKTYLSVKIFQTLSQTEALAHTTDKFDVVKIETASEIYYDGKQIKGNFTLVDTYTYETTEGWIKTIPVYVLTSEYKKYPARWK